MSLERVTPSTVDALRELLDDADLTVAGLDDPSVRLWLERNESGVVTGSTGYEVSGDGTHALIRSVAVAADRRAAGAGSRLARFALEHAAASGATRAWLFSRRSGPFWQKLGFEQADTNQLAAVLADAHQVRLFERTGQLQREVAWSRELSSVGELDFRAVADAR